MRFGADDGAIQSTRIQKVRAQIGEQAKLFAGIILTHRSVEARGPHGGEVLLQWAGTHHVGARINDSIAPRIVLHERVHEKGRGVRLCAQHAGNDVTLIARAQFVRALTQETVVVLAVVGGTRFAGRGGGLGRGMLASGPG